nr:putative ribonuclease H-like domain-containing protein [Tanacetum cinerariifolium]
MLLKVSRGTGYGNLNLLSETMFPDIQGNPQQALKDKGVIDSGGKITGKGKITTGKLDFDDVYFVKELKFNLFSVSQMCDKKNNVIFTDTECIVLSFDFMLLDENHVLLRVPRENNMYNVDLKNIVPSGDLTCLFMKATLDESNLCHRRLGHINFKTMNKLVKDPLCKFDGKDDEGFLVGYSISRSGPTWLFDIDTLTKSMNYQPVIIGNQPNFSADNKNTREAQGKSLVELSTGIKNLSEEFKDFSDNNTNKVNAARTPAPAVGQNSTNSTNTFSAAGHFNTVVSPTLRKSSYGILLNTLIIQICQLWKTLLIQMMKKMTHYEEAFAPVARIETIRLFLAYASFMVFMVYQMDVKSAFFYGTIKEDVYVCQPLGFEELDYPDKVYKVVKTLYGLHQAPRAWYKTLANYLLENGFQRGKIDQTLFIKKQKGDILLV